MKPNDANAYLNRGAVYAFLKQDEAAEQDFQKAISIDPHALQAYANLAGFYLYKKDPKKAEEIYRQEIASNPTSPVPYLRLAGLLMQEGRKADAEEMVQQLRGKQPTSADVAIAIGDFYIAARNPDAGLKEYQRGLNFDPKNQQLQVRVLETMLNSGKIEDATKLTDRLLKDNPGDITARITNGRLLAIKGNTADAVIVLREVIKDAPENPQAHYIFGQVLRETRDMPGSQERVAGSQPDRPE